MKQLYVNYTIMGRDYQAGPYRSINEADDNRRDINTSLALPTAGSPAAVTRGAL